MPSSPLCRRPLGPARLWSWLRLVRANRQRENECHSLVRSGVRRRGTSVPATAIETVKALDELAQRTTAGWQHLVDQVVPADRQPPGFRSGLHYILRGAAVGEALLDAMVARPSPALRPDHDRERELLFTALAHLLPPETGA